MPRDQITALALRPTLAVASPTRLGNTSGDVFRLFSVGLIFPVLTLNFLDAFNSRAQTLNGLQDQSLSLSHTLG